MSDDGYELLRLENRDIHVCQRCGAVVGNLIVHDRWHADLVTRSSVTRFQTIGASTGLIR